MSLFCFGVIHKNGLLFLIVFLLFSLLSACVSHGLVETREHYDNESFFKQVANNNKQSGYLRKFLKELRTFFLKILKLAQIQSNSAILVIIRLVLCNRNFSKVSMLHLFSVLCAYFHGGKFKDSMNHSDLLPLMAG